MRMTCPILAILSVTALGAATSGPSAAQTNSGKAVPPMVGNSMQTNTDESLSSKLNKSNGVITPNATVDPGIKVPAPDPHPNSTPVIPPSVGGGVAK